MEETFIYRSEERHFSEDAEMPGTPAEKLKGSPVVKGSEENRQYCCRGVGSASMTDLLSVRERDRLKRDRS
jgi:hypothetical protein